MADVLGRNVRVEVGLTELAAVAATAMTAANPAVVSATSHGYANGDVVYIDTIVGQEETEGQASRVSATAAGTYAMEGFSSIGKGTFVSGMTHKISTWGTLAKAQKVSISKGSRTRLDAKVLLDRVGREVLGAPGAVSFDIEGLSDVRSAAILKIRDAAETGAILTFRLSSPSNAEVRIFRGYVDDPGEEWNVDALTTSGLSGAMVGRWLAYGAP